MSAEPSMEEILSSIKRIIAEEGDAPSRLRRAPRAAPVQPQVLQQSAPAATPAPVTTRYFDDEDDDPEVLELSDPIPALDAVPDEASLEEAAPMPQTRPEPVVAAARQPAAAPQSAAPTPSVPTPSVPTHPIMSDRVAEASRSSLDNLSRLMAQPEPAATSEKADGDSLEAVVRAMLRPMLREWLDANLPAIVETMVAGEIARITGQPR